MNELTFQVKFLSDIVLPASSNTEGNIENLDFIPGSNFLGMVAKSYSDFNDSFKVFHSGAVRFGDATLLHEGKATYKMPLSFFHEKLNKNEMVNHHLIEDFTKFKQLKQKRKGYITQELEEVSFKYNYAQKSAYDKEKRRSKDSSMYGYSAIPSGTLWQFSVKYDVLESEDVERIKNNLLGKKRLGKSKSSQYGQIEISEAQKVSTVACGGAKTSTILLYAKSRLALVDEEGNPTYNLKYLIDGIDESNIVWEKSQIKTSTFTPYNGAMQTKSYERVVINSGSVIVLQNLSDEQLKSLKDGVGIYLSEGFGEVLVNPIFLENKGLFSLGVNVKDKTPMPLEITEPIVKFLNKRESRKREKLDLAMMVHEFMETNKKLYQSISNSQWGTIRSICSGSNTDFRDEIRKYVSDGKVTWKTEQIESLLEEGKSRAFIELLSMQMPKVKEEK
jgi:hypothetical protein